MSLIISRDDTTWLYSVDFGDGKKRIMPSATTIIDSVCGSFRGFDVGLVEDLIKGDVQTFGSVERLAARALMLATKIKNAGSFGTNVHLLTELDDAGVLDESSLSPALVPVLGAWRKFKQDYEPEMIVAETKIASKLGYAGTLDRLAMVKGKTCLLEIKSRVFCDWRDPLQTAAYKAAWEEMTGQKLARRYVVSLLTDGSYKAVENKGQRDFEIFRCALAIKQWRENHGAK